MPEALFDALFTRMGEIIGTTTNKPSPGFDSYDYDAKNSPSQKHDAAFRSAMVQALWCFALSGFHQTHPEGFQRLAAAAGLQFLTPPSGTTLTTTRRPGARAADPYGDAQKTGGRRLAELELLLAREGLGTTAEGRRASPDGIGHPVKTPDAPDVRELLQKIVRGSTWCIPTESVHRPWGDVVEPNVLLVGRNSDSTRTTGPSEQAADLCVFVISDRNALRNASPEADHGMFFAGRISAEEMPSSTSHRFDSFESGEGTHQNAIDGRQLFLNRILLSYPKTETRHVFLRTLNSLQTDAEKEEYVRWAVFGEEREDEDIKP